MGDNDGNDNNDNNKGGNGSNGTGGGGLGDFLDPNKSAKESDNLKRARAQISEESLPINFGDAPKSIDDEDDFDEDVSELFGENEPLDNDTTNDNNNNNDNENNTEEENTPEIGQGKIDLFSSSQNKGNNSTSSIDLLASNPYLRVVSKLSPSDLISKFTSSAHPRVQDAVRSTILGLIGTLPKMAFETTTITTGERLASLMFQLQMTGYMFKNAEYRLSLSQSLTSVGEGGQFLLGGDDGEEEDDDDDDHPLSEGKVRGKIKISYGKKGKDGAARDDDAIKSSDDGVDDDNANSDGNDYETDEDDSMPSMEVEVDAAAYMSELRDEVAKLRDDLDSARQEKEEAIRKDLLLYIRTLPKQELQSLTGTMSDDVLTAMKGLVNVVLGGIVSEGQIGPETVTEQSGEAMAQLCMWQLAVGYNLRELEVREEMKLALNGASVDVGNGTTADDNDGSGDGDGGGGDSSVSKDHGEGSIDFEKGGFE